MSPGATFERVYLAIKEQLGSGSFRPGAHLEPAALSSELNSSITPVRDALHRLVGEGLVDAPRGDGFRIPPVTELGLRHLYRWNAALLDLAARAGARAMPAQDTADQPDLLARTERLFLAIVTRSANPEHLAAVVRVNERLRAIRRVEMRLLGSTDAELADIDGHLNGGDPAALRRAIAAYHRKRERLAPDTVAALHAGD